MTLDIITKPFRFLKNLMRWYDREGENILIETRSEEITPELWNKAADNFKKRGLPVPMYLNHDSDCVVGVVEDIEARDDGLYVTKHTLFDKGRELVETKEYCLPSGDFVLHYDEDKNIVDLEVYGVSLVNNEGAKDVEMVTCSKDNKDDTATYSGVIIKTKQNKSEEDALMERAELLEALMDDEFLASLPDDLKEKLASLKASDNKDADNVEPVELSKEDEITKLLVDAGVAQEVIDAVLKVVADTVEDATQDGEGEDEDKKEDAEQDGEDDEDKKDKEDADMSKFEDMVLAKAVAEGNASAVPTSVKMGKTILKRTYKDMGDKAYDLALSQVKFVGGKKVEKVDMNKDKSLGEISKTLLGY